MNLILDQDFSLFCIFLNIVQKKILLMSAAFYRILETVQEIRGRNNFTNYITTLQQ